jgi:hypothetical protein
MNNYCDKFHERFYINPVTNRAIMPDGQTYKKLVKNCGEPSRFEFRITPPFPHKTYRVTKRNRDKILDLGLEIGDLTLVKDAIKTGAKLEIDMLDKAVEGGNVQLLIFLREQISGISINKWLQLRNIAVTLGDVVMVSWIEDLYEVKAHLWRRKNTEDFIRAMVKTKNKPLIKYYMNREDEDAIEWMYQKIAIFSLDQEIPDHDMFQWILDFATHDNIVFRWEEIAEIVVINNDIDLMDYLYDTYLAHFEKYKSLYIYENELLDAHIINFTRLLEKATDPEMKRLLKELDNDSTFKITL